MDFQRTCARRLRSGVVLSAGVLACLWLSSAAPVGGQQKPSVLRIGTSNNMTGDKSGKKEESALVTLKDFIKEETGFSNTIEQQKDWRQLAERMAKGELHLGAFQGYEFAWAQQKYPKLKPLALAINVHLYPSAYVVVPKASTAKKVADLKGKPFALPATGHSYLRLFLEHEAGTPNLEAFFAKISAPDNFEDALDDVVDGNVQGGIADRAALEAYKRRKPGRFNKLRELAHSQPFPPVTIAYYDNVLDAQTRKTFQNGVFAASKKEKGEMMLTLFKLTGFEHVPSDFEKVLTRTRKLYAPDAGAK